MLPAYWLSAASLSGLISAVATDCSTSTSNDGSIDLMVIGGFAPFEYDWSNGATTEDINNLPPGEYCVTVTDALCGEASLCITVCAPMKFIWEEINPCPGEYFGAITITGIIGGQEPYTYSWDNGSTQNFISDLTTGNYCVTVTDANECTSSQCFELLNELSEGCSNDDCPDFINGIFTVNPCFGQSSGALYVYFNPGAQPSSYQWNNGVTTQYNSNIPAGYYCVTVTDVNNCTDVMCQTLNEQTYSLTVSLNPTPPSSPMGNDGAIDATVSGGYQPYEYLWTGPNGFTATTQDVSGLTAGDYCLRVRGPGCHESTECITLGYSCPDLIYGIEHNGYIQCEGETGSFTASLTGEGTPPISILWSNGATTQTIDNLDPGYYSVTVSDAAGCSNTHGLQMYVVNEALEVEVDINSSCYSMGGAISLDISGGSTPYAIQWNNGQTTATISDLLASEYCVTITDNAGCTYEDCYTVSSSNTEVASVDIQNNSCGSDCDGSIVLEVNSSEPLSYLWNETGATTKNIYGLCAGEYTVNISSGDCVDTYTYTVEGEEDDFEFGVDYEVEVIWHFDNSFVANGSAVVEISSDLMTAGDVDISTSPTMNPIIASTFIDAASGIARVSIPIEYSNTNTFYFRHTAPDGCIHDGYFGMIPTCGFPDAGFSFNITPLDDGQQACGVGQSHAYQITVNNVGNNAPYYIEATMIEASHPSEQDFKKIEEYNNQSSFIIDGIPAGNVRFEAKNKCEYGAIQTKTHINCCFGIECGVIYEGDTDAYDGSYFYDYPYFRLYVGETCFDPDCSFFDQNCSEVWVDLHSSAPDFNCWTGTVTIDYPDNTSRMFEVVENSPGADQLVWLTNDNRWKPNSPGTYWIEMTYEGTGGSIGEDCQETLEINYYGNGNYNDAVGLDDNFWFDIGAPDQFMNSYFGAFRCEMCGPDNEYLVGGSISDCSSTGNWDFTYFDFTPNDYTSEDPCNSGGTLRIIDFDENGNAVIQEVPIPAGASIGSLTGVRPFGISIDEWCENAGWCLFDAMTIPGLYDNVDLEKPLLATWAESCEDIIWDDSDGPNPDPCTGINGENPCPPGFGCADDGNCYELCDEDGECLYGTCVDGFCIEDGSCQPSCPPDYECIEGDCYLDDICHFNESVTGGTGVNTYEFYHNLAPGTKLYFYYNTLSRRDQIYIHGSGIDELIEDEEGNNCIAEEDTKTYIIMGGNTITIEITPCQTNSEYHFSLTCETQFQGELTDALNNTDEDFLIYPNPFNDRIDIVVQDLDATFDGAIVLLDNLGREVISKEVTFEPGSYRTSIESLSELASGIYFMMIRKEGQIYSTQKLVKM